MRFTTLTFAAIAAFSVSAQLTPGGVVKSIEEITDLSDDTNDILMDLQTGGPTAIFSVVPKAISSLKDIITTATKDVSMLSDAGPVDFPKDGQQDICDAFRSFVKVHQNLLETLIGQKGVLSGTPFTAPIAAILRAIEGVVDKLAFGIIDLVPTCADGAKQDADALSGTIDKAIKEFSFKLPFGA